AGDGAAGDVGRHLLQQRHGRIGHAVAVARAVRLAVMHLAGMNEAEIAGAGVAPLAPQQIGLAAGEDRPEGVGIVGVRRIAVADEARLQQLEVAVARLAPVAGAVAAAESALGQRRLLLDGSPSRKAPRRALRRLERDCGLSADFTTPARPPRARLAYWL